MRSGVIAVAALIGGWFAGGFVMSAGWGGAFWWAMFSLLFPFIVCAFARFWLPLLGVLPAIAMNAKIETTNAEFHGYTRDLGVTAFIWSAPFIWALAVTLLFSMRLRRVKREGTQNG